MGPADRSLGLTWFLFDVGQTLLHPAPDFPSAFAAVCARAGLEVAPEIVVEAAAATWRQRPGASGNGYSLSRQASHAYWTGLYSELLEHLGEPPQRVAPLADALYAHFSSPASYELYPDALPALERCRAAGMRLGIVSNFEAWLTDCLAALGVLPLLEVTAISGVEGYEKPDPRLFEIAVARTGADPGEIGYVGDSVADDMVPARAIGLRPLLLDRDGLYPGYEGRRIESLLDVHLPAIWGR